MADGARHRLGRGAFWGDLGLGAFRGQEILAQMYVFYWSLVLLATRSSGARFQQRRLGKDGPQTWLSRKMRRPRQG